MKTLGDVMADVSDVESERAVEEALALVVEHSPLIGRLMAKSDEFAVKAREDADAAWNSTGSDRAAYIASAGRYCKASRALARLTNAGTVHTDMTVELLKKLLLAM